MRSLALVAVTLLVMASAATVSMEFDDGPDRSLKAQVADLRHTLSETRKEFRNLAADLAAEISQLRSEVASMHGDTVVEVETRGSQSGPGRFHPLSAMAPVAHEISSTPPQAASDQPSSDAATATAEVVSVKGISAEVARSCKAGTSVDCRAMEAARTFWMQRRAAVDAFEDAVKEGNSELTIQFVLKGVDPDHRLPEGTPLTYAAKADMVDTVSALLSLGASPETRDTFSMTALHEAARTNRPDMASVLVGGGADITANATLVHDYKALHFAVENNALGVAESLLKAGANVDSPTRESLTPLVLAACEKHIDMMKLLLRYGANPYFTKQSTKSGRDMDVYTGCLQEQGRGVRGTVGRKLTKAEWDVLTQQCFQVMVEAGVRTYNLDHSKLESAPTNHWQTAFGAGFLKTAIYIAELGTDPTVKAENLAMSDGHLSSLLKVSYQATERLAKADEGEDEMRQYDILYRPFYEVITRLWTKDGVRKGLPLPA